MHLVLRAAARRSKHYHYIKFPHLRSFSGWKGDARDRKTNLSGLHEEESAGPDDAHNFEARARREHKASTKSETTFEELPVGYRCTVFHSPDSMLVRGLGGLMALNGVGAAGGSLLAVQEELTKLYAILQAAEMDNQAPTDFLLATNMPLPVSAMM
jgi:hypothetical protein